MGRSRSQVAGRSWKLVWAFVGALILCAYGGCSGNKGGKSGNGSCSTDADCGGARCCHGSCLDTGSDSNNCGACGHVCPSNNKVCSAGRCVCQQLSGGAPPTVCAAGELCCSDPTFPSTLRCVGQGPQNCGGCGVVCTATGSSCCSSGSNMACTAPNDRLNCGGCGLTCLPEDECCGGQCADNNDNCGKCGRACPAGEVCVETTPGHDCFPVDAGTDAAVDAGDAGDPCANVTCSGKTCCALGGIPSCVDLNTDVTNCGHCGNICVGGETCNGGGCVATDGGVDGGACLTIGTSCAGDAGNVCCANTTCGPIDGQSGTACCLKRGSTCGTGGCCGVTAGSALPQAGFCTQGTCCQSAHAVCGADPDCCAGTPGGKCSTNYYGANPPFGQCCLGSQDTCSNNSDCCDGDCNGGKCCEITTCRPGGNDCCPPGICRSNGSCCLPSGSDCSGFIGAMGCCSGGCDATTLKCQ